MTTCVVLSFYRIVTCRYGDGRIVERIEYESTPMIDEDAEREKNVSTDRENNVSRDRESKKGDPEPEGARGPALRGLAADVRGWWRDAKALLLKAMWVGDMIGDLALEAYELGGRTVTAIGRHGRRVAVFAAAVGVTSPATGGWGFEALATPAWRAWVPVLALPLLGLLLRGVIGSFGPIDRESKRGHQRAHDERPEPDLGSRLELDAKRRRTANAQIATTKVDVPLEQHSFVLDVLDEAHYQLKVRGQAGMALALYRYSGKKGCREAAVRGVLDDVVRANLGTLAWEDMTQLDLALSGALEPLECFHAWTAFSVGRYDYVLVGVSGSAVPGHASLEISHAATRMVERLAFGGESGAAGAVSQ